VTSVSDKSTALLGGTPATKGSSPHRLLVSTIGDELKMAGRHSKVIGISIKDRSAILPIRMNLYPDQRWIGGCIPIFFHWVLASFILISGKYHRTTRT
jgi:hypothetical protein